MVNKKDIFGRRVRDSNTKNRFFKYINKKQIIERIRSLINRLQRHIRTQRDNLEKGSAPIEQKFKE